MFGFALVERRHLFLWLRFFRRRRHRHLDRGKMFVRGGDVPWRRGLEGQAARHVIRLHGAVQRGGSMPMQGGGE